MHIYTCCNHLPLVCRRREILASTWGHLWHWRYLERQQKLGLASSTSSEPLCRGWVQTERRWRTRTSSALCQNEEDMWKGVTTDKLWFSSESTHIFIAEYSPSFLTFSLRLLMYGVWLGGYSILTFHSFSSRRCPPFLHARRLDVAHAQYLQRAPPTS